MNTFSITNLPVSTRFHFIGIGGISMSGLAKILVDKGFKVQGSDMRESELTYQLQKSGIDVCIGHSPENIKDADIVVYTAAVKESNCEYSQAKARGLILIERAVLLGAIMREFKNAVAIAGTHGKTTTTSMITHAIMNSGCNPTVSVGGELDLIGGNVHVGSDNLFITEACEYHESFLQFFPTVSVITNIEEDHLDYFTGGLKQIMKAFSSFANLTPNDGCVVACGEDENVKKVTQGLKCKVYTYGEDECFDFYAENIVIKNSLYSFDVMHKSQKVTHISLNVPGRHNMLNALATVAVCYHMGFDIEKAAGGIEAFTGTHRRFEHKGKCNGAFVIDDYAHHPTEIQVTLKAAKDLEHRRIWCVFQPHTYSRTRTLMNEFAKSFSCADKVIIATIYPAREAFDPNVRETDLVEKIKQNGVDACYIDNFDDIASTLKENLEEGDIVFTMGAGNVVDIAKLIVD